MKKFLLIAISTLMLGACGTSRLVTNDDDDLYADPAKEKIEKERLAAKLKKEQEEEAARKQEELAKQKAKDDANPLYKDSEYNKDDYYDYQYASRVKRFGNASGLGYYDNYYTNSYFYNNNPYSYGTSIYSSYSWNSPYGNYNTGLGYGCGGYNSFGNSYGYNSGYYNGYNNGYYSGYNNYPYGYGYNAYNVYGYNPYGYNPYGYNPYGYNNNNWGYYNSYDVNSKYKNMTYGVRGGHGGGNSPLTSTGGKDDDYVVKYMQGVAQKQENTPKFTEFAKPVKTNGFDNSNFNSGNSGSGFSKQNNSNSGSNSGFINDNNNPNRNSFNSVNGGDYNNVNRNNDGSGNTITKPTFKNSMNSDNNPTIITPNNNNNSPRINTGSEPAKIGGGNTPAISLPNVGGGGVSRPR